MKATVLFVSANPTNTSKLDLDVEYKAIDHERARALHRDAFLLVPVLAAAIDDLRHKLIEHCPAVVHFGGHGVAVAGGIQGERDLIPAPPPASHEAARSGSPSRRVATGWRSVCTRTSGTSSSRAGKSRGRPRS
jgi:hypothetical protein